MKFLYGLYGANIPVIREFDISKTEEVEAGQIIRRSSDGVISPSSIGECVGVAAEDHSGKEDILNARANGSKLRVDITGGGVYSLPAPRLTATKAGTATTFICGDTTVTSALMGSKLVLLAKGENSSNTDSVGTERVITNVSVSSGVVTVTLSAGGATSEGDVYVLVPIIGFKGNVAEDGKSFTPSTATGIVLTVMGYDERNLCLEVLLGTKYFN